MALARMPTMGFDLSTSLAPVSGGLAQAFAVLRANAPYLEAYKAAYGPNPIGQTITLGNGVQGHFTGETDPSSGQPIFIVDFTPSSFRDAAISNYNAQQSGAPAPYPPPPVYQPPPPPSFPGAPSYPGAPGSYPGAAPAMVTSSSAAAKPLLGIPPIALIAGGGLLVFLIARRL